MGFDNIFREIFSCIKYRRYDDYGIHRIGEPRAPDDPEQLGPEENRKKLRQHGLVPEKDSQ